MNTSEIPPSLLTQLLFDLSNGDDDFVIGMLDMFGITRPSDEGMALERALSDTRMKWASPYADHIKLISLIAAKITVCSNLEQPEDPDLVIEEINAVAAAMEATITAAFGAIAQAEFQRGHRNCQTSG